MAILAEQPPGRNTMNADLYEPWRQALIAFLVAEGHQMANSLECLRRGDPMTEDNRRIIRGIIAAHDVMQPRLWQEAA